MDLVGCCHFFTRQLYYMCQYIGFLLLNFGVFLVNVCGNCLDADTKHQQTGGGKHSHVLVFVMVLACIFFLVLLGTIKGLIGLYLYPPIGLCGLSDLTELPVPLERYYEPEFQKVQVQYDETGWPVHPFTNKRTVRVLPKNTELFLNTIFFLAYPITVCEELLWLCCSKGSEYSDSGSVCYESVATIRLLEQKSRTNVCTGPVVDMYYDDEVENEDTQYVLDQLQQSKESLKKMNDSQME